MIAPIFAGHPWHEVDFYKGKLRDNYSRGVRLSNIFRNRGDAQLTAAACSGHWRAHIWTRIIWRRDHPRINSYYVVDRCSDSVNRDVNRPLQPAHQYHSITLDIISVNKMRENVNEIRAVGLFI